LLADQGIFVLRRTADSIAAGDDVCRFDHRQINVRFMFLDPGIGGEVLIRIVLNQADRLHATCDYRRNLVDDDALSGQSDRLQTGAAEAIDAHGSGRYGQPAAQSAKAGHIFALWAFVKSRAQDDILDLGRIEPGTLHGMLNHVTGERDAPGIVEGASEGLSQGRAGGRDNHGFGHVGFVNPVFCSGRPAVLRASSSP
jgi:hypothetical protein